ncbi:hypothetical protein GWK08_17540 [Leptobacterium flavescens]|uniref:DUF3829 domain-containing protein n=1 Tax=Leptobacterium flavescens TaxID=472055 RepID=A0A6P0UPK2_9FLAO|nr:hypothetical protein [Leptobacterium flavescens]NER15264.1 hypothetical protein [Leptobacterium flavescens]
MKRIRSGNRYLLLILGLALVLNSCVNLRSVNSYSLKSTESLKKFEEISYSFAEHCLDRCQFESVQDFSIKRTAECDCKLYEDADKAATTIYKRLRGYFEALSALTNNELTDYSLDALKEPLTAGGFGSIEIEAADVNAASHIATILLRATTDLYRKNKTKTYVAEANADIQILLKKFNEITRSNLSGLLDFKKERLFSYYRELLVDTSLSTYEKAQAGREYYQELSAIDTQQRQIEAFARSVDRIAKGHQELYENRNKMTAKEFKELIRGYTGDLRNIISEFNALKR